MICTMSKHEAEAEGYDDALMLDWEGRIAESTGSNIFIVMGRQQVTHADSRLLPRRHYPAVGD